MNKVVIFIIYFNFGYWYTCMWSTNKCLQITYIKEYLYIAYTFSSPDSWYFFGLKVVNKLLAMFPVLVLLQLKIIELFICVGHIFLRSNGRVPVEMCFCICLIIIQKFTLTANNLGRNPYYAWEITNTCWAYIYISDSIIQ